MLKPTGKDQEHAARIVPRSRTWEELSVPGSVADGGESKPAEGGADTPDRMVRENTQMRYIKEIKTCFFQRIVAHIRAGA